VHIIWPIFPGTCDQTPPVHPAKRNETHQELLKFGGQVMREGRNMEVANDQDEDHLVGGCEVVRIVMLQLWQLLASGPRLFDTYRLDDAQR
jgi:hypothetical protein